MSKRGNINVLKPKFRIQETLDAVQECLEAGWTGMGFKTEQFEKAWSDYTGLENSVFQNSATASLHTAIAIFKRKFGWQNGDEILTSPLTFVSTNHAILYENLEPRFVDVDESLTLSPRNLLQKINDKSRAVIFVALGGNSGNLSEIQKICKDHGLILILDAAHASGSTLDGKDLGKYADVACYSFQAVKNLPTADSGMICFNDIELSKEARKFSWLGIDKDTFARSKQGTYLWDYEVEDLGYKYNGNSIMAAIGLIALKYLDLDNERRREIAKIYHDRLQGIPNLQFVKHNPLGKTSQHLVQILVDNRKDLIEYLATQGIFVGVHYKDNREYKIYEQREDSCPYSTFVSARLISLPNHLWLTDEDIQFITDQISDFYGQ